jgi:hypothetical protein
VAIACIRASHIQISAPFYGFVPFATQEPAAHFKVGDMVTDPPLFVGTAGEFCFAVPPIEPCFAAPPIEFCFFGPPMAFWAEAG